MNEWGITKESIGAVSISSYEILNSQASKIVHMIRDMGMDSMHVAIKAGVTQSMLVSWMQRYGFQRYALKVQSTKEVAERCRKLEECPAEPNVKPLGSIKKKMKKEAAVLAAHPGRRSGKIPSIEEVQKEARKRGLTYGIFMLSPEYDSWRKLYG